MRKAYHMFLREKLAAEGEAIQEEIKRQRGPTPPRAKRIDISFENPVVSQGIQADGSTFETYFDEAQEAKLVEKQERRERIKAAQAAAEAATYTGRMKAMAEEAERKMTNLQLIDPFG